MKIISDITDWLETHACTPSYGGWVLAGIALCFFGAATNTMAGWLYVISGTIIALLVIAATLSVRSLKKLQVKRLPISPVSAGNLLTLELLIQNPTSQPQTLLQVHDILPYILAQSSAQSPIELIPPQSSHRWVYYQSVQQRGIYRWHEVQLKTATPLGLFWCRRSRKAPAKAIVYPQVLPLKCCPLLDTTGQEDSTQFSSDRRFQAATVGITKALRPYRQGDPTRLIHWRTSARYGELQVRELEVITGSQEIVICLDSAARWQQEAFEQAVIAAASLYFYADQCQLNVKLWTAGTGLLQGKRVVLEALAATYAEGETRAVNLPSLPLVWLTQNSSSCNQLPKGSRWVFFPPTSQLNVKPLLSSKIPGLVIDIKKSLQSQLLQTLR